MRLGKWVAVVAGAVLVLNVSSIAQEQVSSTAQEQVSSNANEQPPVDPPAPPPVDPPAPPPADPPAPPPVDPPAPPPEEPPAPPKPAVAKFVDINDAVPLRFFDAERTAEGAREPSNTLTIVMHSGGIDWKTFKATDFRASTAAFSYAAAMDTISFRVEAPEGFYIARITYAQAGTGSIIRTGKAAGSAQWVVGAFAAHLGVFGTNPKLEGEADLTGLEVKLTSVPVSITNSMFAFATPTGGSASLEVTSAEVQVHLMPIESK